MSKFLLHEEKLWLQAMGSNYSLEETMKKLAEELIVEYSKKHPRAKYPYKIERLAKFRGILKRLYTDDPKITGFLKTVKGGFVAVLPRDNPRRRNYTLAHEIGHTYFFDRKEPTPRQITHFQSSSYVERLCDVFAANLLMPAWEMERFKKDINSRCYHNTIESIANNFRVSVEALVVRIDELEMLTTPYVFILFQKAEKDSYRIISKKDLPIKIVGDIPIAKEHVVDTEICVKIDKVPVWCPGTIKRYGSGKYAYHVGIYYFKDEDIPSSLT